MYNKLVKEYFYGNTAFVNHIVNKALLTIDNSCLTQKNHEITSDTIKRLEFGKLPKGVQPDSMCSKTDILCRSSPSLYYATDPSYSNSVVLADFSNTSITHMAKTNSLQPGFMEYRFRTDFKNIVQSHKFKNNVKNKDYVFIDGVNVILDAVYEEALTASRVPLFVSFKSIFSEECNEHLPAIFKVLRDKGFTQVIVSADTCKLTNKRLQYFVNCVKDLTGVMKTVTICTPGITINEKDIL